MGTPDFHNNCIIIFLIKERINKHEMDAAYENDRMSSYKCTCKEMTCEDHFTYNGALSHHVGAGCSLPTCDEVVVDACDSWKKKVFLILIGLLPVL